MSKRVVVQHKNQDCYIIDAILVKDGQKTMRVSYEGKPYFFPKRTCEFISPGKCAIQIEQFDMLFDQDRFKKTVMVKAVFRRNNQKVPAPRLKRIGKN
jgi:hypothetical protein